jgi:hypothetical protein
MKVAGIGSVLFLVVAAACSSNSERAISPPPEGDSQTPASNSQTTSGSKPMTHRDHYIARLGDEYDRTAQIRENPELGAGDWKFFDQVSEEPGPPGYFLNPLGVDAAGHFVSRGTGSDWKVYLRDPAVAAENVHAAYAFLSGTVPISPGGGYALSQVSDEAQALIEPPVLERASDESVRFHGWFGSTPSPGRSPVRIEIVVTADGEVSRTRTPYSKLASEGE